MAPVPAGPLVDDERQTLMDTLAAYTRDNAWVAFDEERYGRLAPGMSADIAVLSHDITQLPPDEITAAQAMLTIFDGSVTFER